LFDVALVTCARLPDLDPDDRLVLGPLLDLGCRVTPAVWDDSSVDWERFDVSIIRSTWDYTDDRDSFVAWARSVSRLLNPAEIVAWNTDKHYLDDLAAAGVPAVPTTWITSSDASDLPTEGEFVIKPSIGAGSIDAERYDLGDAPSRELATNHVRRLTDAGRTVMLQPFAHAIDELGETAVILIDGRFSHAVRKGAMLGNSDVGAVDDLYRDETITPSTATDDQIELAMRAVAAVPVDVSPLLYARVDMVPGSDGRPILMELELTEPSLFMVTTPGSERTFAAAIAARARQMAASRT
jgi:glutathione synthase/RimK-type ligase-like ATP-grasp enzyme